MENKEEPAVLITGMVIFYEICDNETIREIGRTPHLKFFDALEIYANTPNPASQLLRWESENERVKVEFQHSKDIKDPKWLKELFECI